MKTIYVSKEDPAIARLVRGAGGKPHRDVQVEIGEEFPTQSTTWQDGSRYSYCLVGILSGDRTPATPGGASPGTYLIPKSHVVVEHTIFCGKDLGYTIGVRPDDADKIVKGPFGKGLDGLNESEEAVLFYTRRLKSRGRREAADDAGVGIADYDKALESLKGKGLLKSNNALSTAGRNVAQYLEDPIYKKWKKRNASS